MPNVVVTLIDGHKIICKDIKNFETEDGKLVIQVEEERVIVIAAGQWRMFELAGE